MSDQAHCAAVRSPKALPDRWRPRHGVDWRAGSLSTTAAHGAEPTQLPLNQGARIRRGLEASTAEPDLCGVDELVRPESLGAHARIEMTGWWCTGSRDRGSGSLVVAAGPWHGKGPRHASRAGVVGGSGRASRAPRPVGGVPEGRIVASHVCTLAVLSLPGSRDWAVGMRCSEAAWILSHLGDAATARHCFGGVELPEAHRRHGRVSVRVRGRPDVTKRAR